MVASVSRFYSDDRIEATLPKDKKYLKLKAKYFGSVENKVWLFYPLEYKKYLDKSTKS